MAPLPSLNHCSVGASVGRLECTTVILPQEAWAKVCLVADTSKERGLWYRRTFLEEICSTTNDVQGQSGRSMGLLGLPIPDGFVGGMMPDDK